MKKALSEMTLKELWELFPIFLTEHRDDWAKTYLCEKERICAFLPDADNYRISHIGSTAIKNIWAKPIVDILIEIPQGTSMESVKQILCTNDYICMSEENNRKSFNRGYTPNGFADKVFHLHLRYFGENNELYFRDYLNDNPTIAKQYEKLKLSLWKKYEHNRDGYTNAKSDFINAQTDKAKATYKSRY